jgi:hypothetical protein
MILLLFLTQTSQRKLQESTMNVLDMITDLPTSNNTEADFQRICIAAAIDSLRYEGLKNYKTAIMNANRGRNTSPTSDAFNEMMNLEKPDVMFANEHTDYVQIGHNYIAHAREMLEVFADDQSLNKPRLQDIEGMIKSLANMPAPTKPQKDLEMVAAATGVSVATLKIQAEARRGTTASAILEQQAAAAKAAAAETKPPRLFVMSL